MDQKSALAFTRCGRPHLEVMRLCADLAEGTAPRPTPSFSLLFQGIRSMSVFCTFGVLMPLGGEVRPATRAGTLSALVSFEAPLVSRSLRAKPISPLGPSSPPSDPRSVPPPPSAARQSSPVRRRRSRTDRFHQRERGVYHARRWLQSGRRQRRRRRRQRRPPPRPPRYGHTQSSAFFPCVGWRIVSAWFLCF